jgi:four helix bundle protein
VSKSFKDLVVWQRAIDLTEQVYRFTGTFPKSEIYGLTSQMRRAAISVASNIAEGSGRGSKRDFRHFLVTARGSICEVQTQLVLAGKLGLARNEKISEIESIANEVGRMLNGLIQSMRKDAGVPGQERNQKEQAATRN